VNLTPRNRLIIQQRAAGRTVQSIAAEHGLSPARVSVICRDHAKDIRIAELEARVREYEEILDYRPAR
jgi:DNA-binding NarL/FixJ family response regulator